MVPVVPEPFRTELFSHDGVTRDVYRAGSGPAIVVMAEMPGPTPKVFEFAIRLVDRGYSVWMPRLFGVAGESATPGSFVRSIVPACVSREFSALATGRTAPVTGWLRALAAAAHEDAGGPGVGAIGMCFTGGFALGMMLDDRLIAPVLSQPSLPLGLTRSHKADLGLSPDDLAHVKARAADGVCVLGMRFTHDRLAHAERFDTLRDELGDAFIGIEIDSSPGNPHGIRRLAHSVVTDDLVDEPGHPTRDALDRVMGFFDERLFADT